MSTAFLFQQSEQQSSQASDEPYEKEVYEQNLDETKPADLRVYQSLKDAQSQLLGLYSGSFKKFNDLTCKICGHLPLQAKECANASCDGQICKPCRDSVSNQECTCGESFSTLREPHKFMKMMMDEATFRCPYRDCAESELNLQNFIQHAKNCGERYEACPVQGCQKAYKMRLKP
jgi:hypothetical protein